jgi:phage-related tail fiber protein
VGAFGGLILTNKGRNLQVKAQTGVVINFTRIGIGDGDLGGTSILELNALKSEKKSLPVTKLKVLTAGQAVVGSVLNNQDITAGFYFREIGVFATDPTEGEILYCYGNAGASADYIPAGSGGSTDLIEKTIDVVTLVGNAANVTATINQSLVFETAEGSKEKADAAEAAAKQYADQLFMSIPDPIAGSIPIADVGGIFVSTNVEDALAEIKTEHATHKADTTAHITAAERAKWDAAAQTAEDLEILYWMGAV